jgi:hypothetical protein
MLLIIAALLSYAETRFKCFDKKFLEALHDVRILSNTCVSVLLERGGIFYDVTSSWTIYCQSYFNTDGLPPISSSWRQAPWGPRPEFLFSNWTLGGYSPYVTSSLTRGWVCRLQFMLVSPAQSFSGSRPTGPMTIFYCLRFETPPTWRVRSPYLYPPGTGWPDYTPRHRVPFSSLPKLAGLQWRYSTRPPRGISNAELGAYTNWKWFGRNLSWPAPSNNPGIFWMNWRIERKSSEYAANFL